MLKANYQTKDLRINANIRGKHPGDVVQVAVDKAGSPIEKYWRDRLKDARKDKCVEWAKKKTKGGKD